MPRFAALDLGSNALRLRIVEAHAAQPASAAQPGHAAQPKRAAQPGHAAGTFTPAPFREVSSMRAAVRLGAEVFVTGRLAMASIGQACSALRDFRQAMDAARVDAYRATATSAVREASNRATLVERARREAGIELEIIEGVEEARLIQLGVVRRLGLADRRALLVDVGGGSTELTLLDRGQNVYSVSLPIGTVRLLETYLRGARTVELGRRRLLDEGVDRALSAAVPRLRALLSSSSLPSTSGAPFELVVGTGGSVDTLADLCPVAGGHEGYPRAVDVGAVRSLLDVLCGMTNDERRVAYSLRPDRADTIVPAATIFLRVAEQLGRDAIVAPGVGLKEGILEDLIDRHFDRRDEESEARAVIGACTRLGERYGFDRAHGELVAKLALQLFDDLQGFHALGDRERLLLRAAALLHDVGDYVRYDGHHKHSHYLIQHSDIMGLSQEERAIVANVARYHRKSPPDVSHPSFRDLDKKARAAVRSLAAILRIADALDREHLGKVQSVRAEADVTTRRLLLHVTGDEDRELEEWTVRAKSELLREVFDLEVRIADATTRPSWRPRPAAPPAPAPGDTDEPAPT